jgi:PKD repeat protein
LVRGFVALVLAVASFSIWSSPRAFATRSTFDPSTLLTVRVNGTAVPVELPEPATDIAVGTTYMVCCPHGSETSRLFGSGWTIATMLLASGVDPIRAESVTVSRPASTTPGITLMPRDYDASQPGGLDFPQRACQPPTPLPAAWSCPAFIFETGFESPAMNFFRPERSDPPTDENVNDVIDSSAGFGLVVDVTTLDHLDVKAHADHTKVRVGQAVHFTASATSPVSGEALTYMWRITDGTTRAGAQLTHAFAHPGSYRVTATATGDRGSGGVSAPITVTVGKKPGSPGPGGGNPSPAPTTGGDHGQPTAPTAGDAGSGAGTGTGTGSGNGTTPGGSASGSTGKRLTHLAIGSVPTSRAVPRSTVVPAAGVEVRGELLANSVAGIEIAGDAGGSALKRATGPGGTDVTHQTTVQWGAVIGIAVALGLFVLGGASERRTRLRSQK